MFPDQFEYFTAETVPEAIELMEAHSDRDVELLAGGHSLIPTMKSGLASPDVVVDINGIESMQGITHDGHVTRIGGLTRYATIAASSAVQSRVELLSEAAGEIADMQVRNRGTIGGNIAHADPASDLPGAALAVDATVVAEGPNGEREIDIDDFFEGLYQTDLEKGELLTQVRIPDQGDGTGSAYAKKPHPGSGYAAVGVGVTLVTTGGIVESARIGANGVVDHAIRLEPVEYALEGQELTDRTLADAADRADDGLDDVEIVEDTYASSTLRRTLLREYTRIALEKASQRIP